MYKATLDLGRINRTMKLKFGLILRDDENNPYNMQRGQQPRKIVDRFVFNGNEYLSINPNPFLTIDISAAEDKNAGWSVNNTVNITKERLYVFGEQLKRMILKFKEPDLFYIQNKTLYVNKKLSEDYKQTFSTFSKKVMMQHAVVMEENDVNQQYEGIIFMIQSAENFCCLTYDELTHLYYEVTHIDLSVLSMQVLNMQAIIGLLEAGGQMRTRVVDLSKSNPTQSEEKPKEEEDIKVPPKIADNTIPNI